MGIVGFCKLVTVVSVGSHFVPIPALFTVAGLAITPVGIVSAVCFFIKHPGKPMTPAQWHQWNALYKQYGLRHP